MVRKLVCLTEHLQHADVGKSIVPCCFFLCSTSPHGNCYASVRSVRSALPTKSGAVIFTFFVFVLTRFRDAGDVGGSVITTRKPHQYWCVYDYEGTPKQFSITFDLSKERWQDSRRSDASFHGTVASGFSASPSGSGLDTELFFSYSLTQR